MENNIHTYDVGNGIEGLVMQAVAQLDALSEGTDLPVQVEFLCGDYLRQDGSPALSLLVSCRNGMIDFFQDSNGVFWKSQSGDRMNMFPAFALSTFNVDGLAKQCLGALAEIRSTGSSFH